MYRVVVIPHWSGCYHVRWIGTDQKICVLGNFIKKVIGTNMHYLTGSIEIGIIELIELGFIL